MAHTVKNHTLKRRLAKLRRNEGQCKCKKPVRSLRRRIKVNRHPGASGKWSFAPEGGSSQGDKEGTRLDGEGISYDSRDQEWDDDCRRADDDGEGSQYCADLYDLLTDSKWKDKAPKANMDEDEDPKANMDEDEDMNPKVNAAYLRRMPKELREVLRSNLIAQRKEKAVLINALSRNRNCTFGNTYLRKQSLATLEKLHTLAGTKTTKTGYTFSDAPKLLRLQGSEKEPEVNVDYIDDEVDDVYKKALLKEYKGLSGDDRCDLYCNVPAAAQDILERHDKKVLNCDCSQY